MNYEEAIAFLKERSKFGINLGLGRITELLRRVGDPHMQGIKFLHITGTNGKGSTSAMLASILTTAGHKTAFFSSPHLDSYCERFRIDGQMISEEQLAEVMTMLAPHLTAMAEEGFEPPTEFEISTAAALCWFAKEKAEYAVMEVGMGGAIDSTNVIPAQVAVITSVAMDHMDYLGSTIEEIAAVKAGIIKQNATVFTPCQGSIFDILHQKAAEMNAYIIREGDDYFVAQGEYSLDGQYFDYRSGYRELRHIALPLLGAHQPHNAGLAVSVALHLGIAEEHIRRGIENVVWPGRLELLSRAPQILLDGAHNVEGMTALTQALQDYFPQKKIIAVLGMLADKEREAAMKILLPRISRVVITRPPNDRARDWQKLADFAAANGVEAVCVENIAEAVHLALSLQEEDELLLVSGSLYLIADARAYLTEVLI